MRGNCFRAKAFLHANIFFRTETIVSHDIDFDAKTCSARNHFLFSFRVKAHLSFARHTKAMLFSAKSFRQDKRISLTRKMIVRNMLRKTGSAHCFRANSDFQRKTFFVRQFFVSRESFLFTRKKLSSMLCFARKCVFGVLCFAC